MRRSLPFAVASLFCAVSVSAQEIAPVVPPPPPKISMPTAAQVPSQAPLVDDVMTVGRPPAAPVNPAAPSVLQRPSASAPVGISSLPSSVSVPVALPERLVGSARVYDGNTLLVGGQVLMLDGVDAPELDQLCQDLVGVPWRCGEKAKARLGELIHGRSVSCIPTVQLDGGFMGTCRAGGEDIASIMAREGLAVIPDGGSRLYAAEQALARGAQRGIWSGSFDKPWVHRTR